MLFRSVNRLGITFDEASYFYGTKKVAKEMYSSTAEGIGMLYPDGMIQDISQVSHIIHNDTVGSGDYKYYFFTLRDE